MANHDHDHRDHDHDRRKYGHDRDRYHPRHHRHLSERELLLLIWENIMLNFAVLNSNLNELSGKVDTLIAGQSSDPADQAAIDAAAAQVKTISDKIDAASTPPPPPIVVLPDTGTPNAIVTVSSPPVVAPRAPNAKARVAVANTNTGPVTYDDGAGPAPVVDSAGNPLVGGELVAGTTYDLAFNGSGWTFGAVPTVAGTGAVASAPGTPGALSRARR